MKVKHALMISFLSLIVLGVGLYLYVEKVNVTEAEILEYVLKTNTVESEITGVKEEENRLVYKLKSTNSDLSFDVYVDTTSSVPTILYSTYEVSLTNKKMQNTLAPYIQDMKELGFNVSEESIKLGKDAKEDQATVFKADYNGDISLFGATEEDYQNIYSLVELLRESKFENLHLDIQGTDGGNIILGDLKRFSTAVEMRHFIADMYMDELVKSEE